LMAVALSVWCCLYSCKTTEMMGRIAAKEIRVKQIASNNEQRKDNIPGLWVKKIKGSVINGGNEYSFKANYRIKRDSIIIISVLNPVGIEAVRILCTPDSFGFVDRINREYYYGRYDVLKKKIGYNANYGFVQSLLLNEIATVYDETKEKFFEKNRKLDVVDNKSHVSLIEEKKDGYGIRETRYDIEFNTIPLQLVRNKISDNHGNYEIDVVYKEFKEVNKSWFPGLISIEIRNEVNRVTCRLELDRITIGTEFNTNFSIGQKYSKIDW